MQFAKAADNEFLDKEIDKMYWQQPVIQIIFHTGQQRHQQNALLLPLP
jgi:hypothetical protein